jgi:hypothetical protein
MEECCNSKVDAVLNLPRAGNYHDPVFSLTSGVITSSVHIEIAQRRFPRISVSRVGRYYRRTQWRSQSLTSRTHKAEFLVPPTNRKAMVSHHLPDDGGKIVEQWSIGTRCR